MVSSVLLKWIECEALDLDTEDQIWGVCLNLAVHEPGLETQTLQALLSWPTKKN